MPLFESESDRELSHPVMTQYQRGDYYEKRVKEFLEVRGFWVWQARQSRGFADLIALRRATMPHLIQVKAGNTPVQHYEWNGLYRMAETLGALPLVAHVSGRWEAWEWQQITGTHEAYGHVWPHRPYHFRDRLIEQA